MFEFFRTHTRWMQVLFLLLILPSFLFLGFEGLTHLNADRQVLAQVGSHKIRSTEVDQLLEKEFARLRQSTPDIDPQALQTPAIRYQALERLVEDALVNVAAQDLAGSTANEAVRDALSQSAIWGQIQNLDGTINLQAYEALLAAQGLTPTIFEKHIRQSMARQRLISPMDASGWHASAVTETAWKVYGQKRAIQFAWSRPSDFKAAVHPTDEDLRVFYQQHQAMFTTPPTATVQYLVLDADTLEKNKIPSSEELKKAYEQSLKEDASAEGQRQARHILITKPKTASAKEATSARAQAEALLLQIQRDPSRFAVLAKAHSQDTGSAEKGGDLGFFGRGMMVKPFEQAVFELKSPGLIPRVIETEFGYHVIELTGIKTPPPAVVFDKLAEGKRQELAVKWRQKHLGRLAAELADHVYENPTNLDNVARQIHLPLQTGRVVDGQTAGASAGSAILANPVFLRALFNPDALAKKQAFRPVKTAPNQWVTARVLTHESAHPISFEQVKTQVQNRVVTEQAIQKAHLQGKAWLEQWPRQAVSAVPMPFSFVLDRDRAGSADLPVAVLQKVWSVPSDQLPSWQGVDLGPEGFVVLRIDRTLPAAVNQPPHFQAHYAKLWADAQMQAYQNWLKTQYKVQIFVEKPPSNPPPGMSRH
jgi:peptidyl-prolyl cis-trans isomerase D